MDIDLADFGVVGLPEAPKGKVIDRIDVIVPLERLTKAWEEPEAAQSTTSPG